MALLLDKSVRREDDHPFCGEPLHVLDHFPSVVLGQMLDDIHGDAGVKLAIAKDRGDVLHVTEHKLIMGAAGTRLIQRRLVAVNAHRMLRGDEPKRRAGATTDVEDGFTTVKGLSRRSRTSMISEGVALASCKRL